MSEVSLEELLPDPPEKQEPGAEIEVQGLRGSIKATENLARREEAMRLRMGGYSYEQIAKILDVHPSRVSQLVKQGLQEAANEDAEQLRVIENARLDRLQAAVWQDALKGDSKAIDTVLKISARRAALNGLDAPKKIDLRAAVKMDVEVALQELQQVVLGEVLND